MLLSALDEFSWVTKALLQKSQHPSVRVLAVWTLLIAFLSGFWAGLTISVSF